MVLVFKGTDGYKQVFNPPPDMKFDAAPEVENVNIEPEQGASAHRYNFRTRKRGRSER